jgi:AAHS family 4-hydroxybenzoate transporter-like MFS transporter
MSMDAAAGDGRIDIGAVLDKGRWGGFQKAVVFAVAAAIILDGFDNQVLGLAVPAILKEWSVTRAELAPALAVGLFGVAVGTIIGGIVGDRIGRKPSLILSVLVFALPTLAIAGVDSIGALAALRFVAGLGIGAALPNASALAAEFTPVTRRSLAVTIAIVCIPTGGILGGLLAGQLLPTLGWRALFVLGGVAPLALALLLLLWLPESPRYLTRRGADAKVAGVLGRMGVSVPAGARFVDLAERPAGRGLSALVSGPYLRDSVALWVAFFFCLMCVYSVFNWVPTLLSSAGLPPSIASSGLSVYNAGGVVGALGCAWLIGVFGSRVSMLALTVGAIVSALALNAVPIGPGQDPTPLMLGLAVNGLFVNAVQTTMYALAAHIYVTEVRASGVGTAAAIGRIGAVVSSYVGATMLDAGVGAYFGLLAGTMVVVLVALALIRKHIPDNARAAAEAEAAATGVS